ncbi:glycosyltransferase family 2 protein [Parabacteroides sp. OttesenSCG-928-N08]|nr:glycosyltransferase family 2 protein [Parabacteroides sp. OttesenSCG-928-N08]
MKRNIWAIVVTYNGEAWIEKCLSSMENSTVNVHIVVIDNCSSDATREIVKRHPSTHLIEMNENLGFGKANNIGFEYVLREKADYVLLINQDAWVEPNVIEGLCIALDQNPTIGIISPVHKEGSGDALDYGFAKYMIKKEKAITPSTDSQIHLVQFINAAIWLMPIRTLGEIGGFDPQFPHYGEDSDYVNRLRYHQLQIGYVASLIGYHDRKARAFELSRHLYAEYIYFLCICKDINHPFLYCLLLFTLRCGKNALTHTQFIAYLKIYMKIVASIPNIIKTRRIVKKKGYTFLSFSPNHVKKTI